MVEEECGWIDAGPDVDQGNLLGGLHLAIGGSFLHLVHSVQVVLDPTLEVEQQLTDVQLVGRQLLGFCRTGCRTGCRKVSGLSEALEQHHCPDHEGEAVGVGSAVTVGH